MKKILKYPVLLVFALIIIVFSVGDLVTPYKEFSELENKEFSKKPELTMASLMDSSKTGFAQRFETYINEQFPLRDSWISLKSVCETLLLKKENNGIIYGKDGYMFDKFNHIDEERFNKNLSSLKTFAEDNPDLEKVLMLSPSAYEVLNEKMPKGTFNIDQKKLLSHLENELSPVGFSYVDLLSTLESKKGENQLFYKTDHHWTTDGAYEAYAAYCQFKGLTPVEKELKTASDDFLGTHFSKCKKTGTKPETIRYYDAAVDKVLINGKEKDGLFDKSKLSERDKYAFFLYGNNGITEIFNEKAEKKETLLILKDSFANCLVPFLTANYEKIVVVDLRFLPIDLSELIEKEKPATVMINYNVKNIISDPDIPRIKY